MDVDARMQLFDLKTKYAFQTQPGVDKYNMPLYNVQLEPGGQSIGSFPVYQGLIPPVYINGIQVPFQTQKSQFYNIWPNIVQNLGVVGVGNGTAGPYVLSFPIVPSNVPPNPPFDGILRGHIDIAGIIAAGSNPVQDPPLTDSATFPSLLAKIPSTSIESAVYLTSLDATGANVVVADSGVFLDTNVNCGLLMQPGGAPFGNQILSGGYSATNNIINYLTGQAYVKFNVPIPIGNNINAQCFFYQSGLPRGFLYYNNTITLRSPPDIQYLVEVDGYLSPAAFFNTNQAIPFAYMAEYIARGAARKIMADTGDIEQLDLNEKFFKEQESLVWKRSQRTFTASRTESIYSQGFGQGAGFNNNYGGGVSL